MWEVSMKQWQMIGQPCPVRYEEIGRDCSWLRGRTVRDVLALSSSFAEIIMLFMYKEHSEQLEDSFLHS
jgi:hypothetical protein